jgi:excisionase family DNA binding protein
LLPTSKPALGNTLPADPAAGAHGAPNTAPAVATTPTLDDLGLLYDGRDRLLTVAEVVEHLGVCNATVYRLCETGDLRHVRVVHSIRIRPQDLAAFLAGRTQS